MRLLNMICTLADAIVSGLDRLDRWAVDRQHRISGVATTTTLGSPERPVWYRCAKVRDELEQLSSRIAERYGHVMPAKQDLYDRIVLAEAVDMLMELELLVAELRRTPFGERNERKPA
jgi:hypothetical protein